MKWCWATVQGWFGAADVQKHSTKVSLCNVVFPPLSFVMIKFVARCIIINDPLAEEIVGSLLDPRRARITGYHVVEHCGPPRGGGELGGWGVGGLG